jgi:hypothetical protein
MCNYIMHGILGIHGGSTAQGTTDRHLQIFKAQIHYQRPFRLVILCYNVPKCQVTTF